MKIKFCIAIFFLILSVFVSAKNLPKSHQLIDDLVQGFFNTYNLLVDGFFLLENDETIISDKYEKLFLISENSEILFEMATKLQLASWNSPENSISTCDLQNMMVESGLVEKSSGNLLVCLKDNACEESEAYKIMLNRAMVRLYKVVDACALKLN